MRAGVLTGVAPESDARLISAPPMAATAATTAAMMVAPWAVAQKRCDSADFLGFGDFPLALLLTSHPLGSISVHTSGPCEVKT
ncbi:hypothetical protein DQ384_08870 [Sphaerisporangium album]|uniref:Uncharacterized protein n=1 Tax=Sphaerisporangium album TaxID=509200 RepID=A0A367FMQ6_9ACTN|nr:hypothetical protein DQ384_08870 [Sphaerisporangium album]